jgi:tyrosyl-tRNA synthetase
LWVPGLLVATGLAASNGEAMRLIEQGAVAIDEDRIEDRNARIVADAGRVMTARRGKRQYARVRLTA